ncbi:WXG100 family type VII secretion target [Actinoplanes sp. NPDC048796]|uniref:WXG100 family type VII secretion target n=1 Tax=unclassified Actinoplanes TaxID=2626549 RepID=UPI0033D0D557
MTSPWGLTPEALALGRTDSMNSAMSINAELGALGRYVDQLVGQWMGVASGTFTVLMAEYHQHAEGLRQTLEGIATNLGANHDAVVNTEHTNIRLLTPHMDAGPKLSPARFSS